MKDTLFSKAIDKLIEKIENKILSEIKEKKNYEEVHKQINEFLKKYSDENFYIIMDNYIEESKIIDKMMLSCDKFVKENIKFDTTRITNDFYKKNNGKISYFNITYIELFFAELYKIIFEIKYGVEKNSSEEKIIAHTGNQIKELEKNVESFLETLSVEIKDIKSKSAQNNVISNDKKFQFVELYESKLFLENDEENQLLLKDMYIPPRCKTAEGKFLDCEKYIQEFMFGEHTDNVLFILGQTSVGKSSLICDLVYKYQFRNDIIALPMKPIDGNETLLNGLRKELRCNDNELEGKILILDGYDETQIIKKKDANINKICLDFIKDLQKITRKEKSLRIIMTVKTSFFDLADWKDNYENTRVMEILNFDRKQIQIFIDNYSKKKMIKIANSSFIKKSLRESKLGIISNPMILYMICHHKGKLGEHVSIESIYEEVFSEKGIFFTTKYKRRGEDKNIIKKGHEMIRSIAFKIFIGNPYILPNDKYMAYFEDNILKQFSETAIDVIYLDEEVKVEFKHESIWHYFVAEYIYKSLENICKNSKIENKEVLKTIDELFSSGNMEDEISKFLSYFIKKRDLANYEAKNKVLINSMEYILEKNCIFSLTSESKFTLLDRIHNAFNGYWKIFTSIYTIICKKQNKEFLLCNYFDNECVWKNLSRLLKNGAFYKLCLRGADFSGRDLRGVILMKSDLEASNLCNVDLRGASLIGTRFCKAVLEDANLNGADLCKADFQNASLKRLKLRGSVLKECKLEKGKNIQEIKFSFSNIMHVKNILESDLLNCYIYDEQGKMIPYCDWKTKMGGKI